MGMATHTSDEKTIDSDFSRISSLKDSLAAEFSSLPLTELSIGMSNDWKIAVRHGATFVRIGTAIFGERQY
jgi:uncharacterized pyridoxal phosphate-containing UPF0001 family protein